MERIVRLEPRQKIGSLSDILRNRLKPGQEYQFWDTNKNAVILDTSLIVQGIYQHKVWAFVALGEVNKLNPYFLILLPHVASELHALEMSNRTDQYGNRLIAQDLLNDLWARDVKLQIDIPEGLEDRIVNMWKSVSRKYRTYLDQKHRLEHPEPDVEIVVPTVAIEPRISPTDIEVIKYALARADKGLPSYVVSGDSDITDTVGGFGHHVPVISIGPDNAPDHIALTSLLNFVGELIVEDVLADIRKAESGNYVLFGRHVDVTRGRKVAIGFKVVDKPVKSENVYSAPIISEGEGGDKIFTSLNNYPRVLVRSGSNMLPTMYRLENLIVSRGRLIDPTGTSKEITLDDYLEHVLGVPRTDKKAWLFQRQYTQKRRFIRMANDIAYLSASDWYMQRYMPQLFDGLSHLRASIQHH